MNIILLLSAIVAVVMALSKLEKVLKTGNDQFTAKMFQEVVKNAGKKSCVLSAFSVLSPLAQVALGSVGESHDEILRVIGFPNDNVMKKVFLRVKRRLKGVKGVELKQANKIFVKKSLTLKPKFAKLSKSVFDSGVKNIDFAKPEKSAKEINRWVEKHTNKRIKDLVTPHSITEDTVAILVNAIYFRGKWQKPFKKESTHDADFHLGKDKKVSVPMMYQTENFKYGKSKKLDAKFLEMPYEGGETSLVVALPNQVDGIADLIKKLADPTALSNALKLMKKQQIKVFLPKFKIETTTDLKVVLEKMGIKKLFIPRQAKLNNISKIGVLYISDAIQKAFIEVNEEGTEAAAANKFGKHRMTAVVYNTIEFKADRPFYFALKYKNIELFNGVYYG